MTDSYGKDAIERQLSRMCFDLAPLDDTLPQARQTARARQDPVYVSRWRRWAVCHDTPPTVAFAARHWGGADWVAYRVGDDAWHFHGAEDGFMYAIQAPGEGDFGWWEVRCLNDAPDCVMQLRPEGDDYEIVTGAEYRRVRPYPVV